MESTRRRVLQTLGIGGGLTLAGCTTGNQEPNTETETTTPANAATTDVDTVAADPTDVPDPIDRDQPADVEVDLTTREVTAEVEPGVTFDYMTFDGQIPGPMIRVRQGDTVTLTLANEDGNSMPHNVDLHAVYGSGGGAEATTVEPGEETAIRFRAEYPGAFVYHCAVPNVDYHISAGMFGLILVEPPEGLPEVDREFYLGQHELYTDKATGEEGHHGFDFDAMAAEDPTYVLLNGEKFAYATANKGPLEAAVGETVRVFLATGGPNLTSNFHPIGNVWTESYPNGAVTSQPDRYVQTQATPPGSALVATMDLPVPETVKFVDHSLSRVVRKGALAELKAEGEAKPEIFDPDPDV
jgi:nitrite reductase (NO-forming)